MRRGRLKLKAVGKTSWREGGELKVDEKFVAPSLVQRRATRQREPGERNPFSLSMLNPNAATAAPPVEERRNKTRELPVRTAVRLRLGMQMCTPLPPSSSAKPAFPTLSRIPHPSRLLPPPPFALLYDRTRKPRVDGSAGGGYSGTAVLDYSQATRWLLFFHCSLRFLRNA